jgi:hypothetical protein
MKRILGWVVPFLLSLPVLAAEEERGAANAPVQTADMIYVVLFLLVFVGAIGGFLVYFFMQRDDSEKSEKQS